MYEPCRCFHFSNLLCGLDLNVFPEFFLLTFSSLFVSLSFSIITQSAIHQQALEKVNLSKFESNLSAEMAYCELKPKEIIPEYCQRINSYFVSNSAIEFYLICFVLYFVFKLKFLFQIKHIISKKNFLFEIP